MTDCSTRWAHKKRTPLFNGRLHPWQFDIYIDRGYSLERSRALSTGMQRSYRYAGPAQPTDGRTSNKLISKVVTRRRTGSQWGGGSVELAGDDVYLVNRSTYDNYTLLLWTIRSAPIIVMIRKVVFANKSRKLGWIWMKLGRWGCGLKRLSLARFQRNCAMGFGESAKKYVAEALFFCQVNDAPLLPLSFDRFPPNFPRTRVQVVARDIWFHIPEKFPLRGRISRKPSF